MSELINRRPINDDLTLHIYKKRCFYDKLWNEETIESRGRITDRAGNVIARPFAKIFNLHENGHRPFHRDEEVIACDKINGYLLNVSLYNDELLFTTKGSAGSENTELGEEVLTPHLPQIKGYLQAQAALDTGPVTLMFEICNREFDPHPIIEVDGSYLLGVRNNLSGKLLDPRLLPRNLSDFVAKAEVKVFGDVVREKAISPREGWFCYSLDMERVCKVKADGYLLKKFFGRMSPQKIETLFYDAAKFERMHDEEFYPIARTLRENFTLEAWLSKNEQQRLEWLRGALQ